MDCVKKMLALVLCVVIFIGAGNVVFAQEGVDTTVKANAVISNNTVTVDVSFENFDTTGTVLAVLLDNDNRITSIVTKKMENVIKISFPKGIMGVKVKVLLWENIINMKPLCEVSVTEVALNEPYGKKLYVDGDSICYGNGYTGGYGKIISDEYNMTLVNSGVGGATISNMSALNTVAYGAQMDWDNTKYYLKLTEYDPFADMNLENFAYPLTKEQYENGFGKYPTAYRMIDGVLTEIEYSESIPVGRFYLKFDVPTYDNNTVTKYYRMWYYKDTDGNYVGNYWLWEAYNSGFDSVHKLGEATIGTERHWLSTSVNNVDAASDYIIFEGGINDYIMNRPLGELTEGTDNVVDTTTVIGGLEYICRTLLEKCQDKKILYVITPKAKEYTNKPNSASAGNKTWTDYHDAIVTVLEKYDIHYVDLFETEFDTSKEEYLIYTRNKDGVHPTKEGYEKFFVPYIVEAMKK